ncbi:hypothetical protein VTO73DRAFT_8158 [Trametes versicolor]
MAHSHRLSCDVPSMVSCCVYLLVLYCPPVDNAGFVALVEGVTHVSLRFMATSSIPRDASLRIRAICSRHSVARGNNRG